MDWLTAAEAAEWLGYKKATIRQYINRGLIRATKRGRDWMIERSEVERFKRERGGLTCGGLTFGGGKPDRCEPPGYQPGRG